MIYFDSAATSYLKPESVAKAVYESFGLIGNSGRGAYEPTLNASRLIYNTRVLLAKLFNIDDASRIAFTANATEALNIAISGLIGPEDHVITSVAEHNSVLRPLYRAIGLEDYACGSEQCSDMPGDSRNDEKNQHISFLPIDSQGVIQVEKLPELLRENTKAVVITHASNVTGIVTDIEKVRDFCRAHNLIFILDASQTAGAVPIDVKKMGIDVLCFTGHKSLFGAQGTGGIYAAPGIEIPSFKVGGSGVHSFDKKHPGEYPTRFEAGTLNGHGIAGLKAGVEFILETGVERIAEREQKLAERFYEGVKAIPGVHVYGTFGSEYISHKNQDQRTAIVSLNIGDMDSSYAADILWEDYEICVRAGAHCAPLIHEAFGTVDQGIIRFSFSYFNTEEEVDKAIEAVRELAEGVEA